MWRNYAAGTFTAKRKNTSAHSPDSSPQHQQQVRRRSSSLSSSLEEFRVGRLKSEQSKEAEPFRAFDGAENQQQQQEGSQREEEEPPAEEPSKANTSQFIDPTAPSPAVSANRQSVVATASSFVPRKPSPSAAPSDTFDSGSDFLLSPPIQEEQRLRTPPLGLLQMPPVKDSVDRANGGAIDGKPTANMFERDSRNDRPPPQMPTTEGIEYPRAASWSSSTVAEIMRDSIGRQVFRCFLHESLAEENLLFVEEVEKLKKEKQPEKIRQGIKSLLDKYGHYINLSSVAMSKLREATKAEVPDPKALELAHKEIYKLLENDQFPRFRRSKLYLGFLEQLLPRSYAERWMTSFDALLGNQVGRHHFRQFLFSVHAEENLRFWESVIEFRQLKNKSVAMLNMGRTIQQQFLREGAHNEVFLPFGLRQRVEKKIREKHVDETLFDDAVKHVEQILKNDPYVRFINSKEYNDLLAKLH